MTWEEISKELFEEKTEKRFELIWETDEMCNVFDNDLNVNSTISVEDVVDLLNEQHETIQRLNRNIDELLSVNVEKELFEENEQLKKAYTQLKHRHSLLHDVCIDAECDRDSYRKDIASLEKENEQLKQSNEDARHILKREFDFATEQRQKHLDDPVVANAYDIIRFDMREALDKLGWLE